MHSGLTAVGLLPLVVAGSCGRGPGSDGPLVDVIEVVAGDGVVQSDAQMQGQDAESPQDEVTYADSALEVDTNDVAADGDIEVPDDGDHWPWGPVAEGCWHFQPSVAGDSLGITSDLAADGERIFFTAASDASFPEDFLFAVDALGSEVWHSPVSLMRRPLPPVVADDGAIYLVANDVDTSGHLGGAYVRKVSKDGAMLWTVNASPVVPDAVFAQFGVLSKAATLDADGNLYVTVGSWLTRFDSDDGAIRWQENMVPDGFVQVGDLQFTPLILNDRILIVDDTMTLLAMDFDGARLVERTGLLDAFGATWLVASRSGRLVTAGRDNSIIVIDADSLEIVAEENGLLGDPRAMLGMDASGNVYGQAHEAMKAYAPDLAPIWVAPTPWASISYNGMVFDQDGKVGLLGGGDLYRFVVFSAASGELLFDEHPNIYHSARSFVLVRPHEAIVVGVDPVDARSVVKCIKVPLGLPDPLEWATPHGSFRNQRRVHSATMAR